MSKRFRHLSALFIFILGLLAFIAVVVRSPGRPYATQYEREISYALPYGQDSDFADRLKPLAARHPGQSGFFIFEKGDQSFMARLALVRFAQKTVDLEYYAVADDVTSNLMMEALLRAAGRGVRVRLLVDSFTVSHMKDALLAFGGTKNIEIRVFNPLMTYEQPLPSKIKTLLTDLPRADRRLHNKALIADNHLAIMGGRNLSDEYFDAGADVAFRDIDVMAAGPVTAEISESFDKYWNDRNAFPVANVYHPRGDAGTKEKLRQSLHDNWEQEIKKPARQKYFLSSIDKILNSPDMKLQWASAEIEADDPGKIEKGTEIKNSRPLQGLLSLVKAANHEFIIISAYFVPREEGVEWMAGLEKRGLNISVLTNSLASNDVVAVHSGYGPYRKALLESGVELYELMPVDHKKTRQRLLGRGQPPRAGLHSKVYIVDGKDTVIGSFNFDPRSVRLNTEMTIIIHSQAVAAQMKKLYAKAVSPEFSYSVTLQDGKLHWRGIEKGEKADFAHDPHSGFWRNIQNFIFTLLPVENQL